MNTAVTVKGTTTVPQPLREALGIHPGTRLRWSRTGRALRVEVVADRLNHAQQHALKRAGTWDGPVSGAVLLRRTRP